MGSNTRLDIALASTLTKKLEAHGITIDDKGDYKIDSKRLNDVLALKNYSSSNNVTQKIQYRENNNKASKWHSTNDAFFFLCYIISNYDLYNKANTSEYETDQAVFFFKFNHSLVTVTLEELSHAALIEEYEPQALEFFASIKQKLIAAQLITPPSATIDSSKDSKDSKDLSEEKKEEKKSADSKIETASKKSGAQIFYEDYLRFKVINPNNRYHRTYYTFEGVTDDFKAGKLDEADYQLIQITCFAGIMLDHNNPSIPIKDRSKIVRFDDARTNLLKTKRLFGGQTIANRIAVEMSRNSPHSHYYSVLKETRYVLLQLTNSNKEKIYKKTDFDLITEEIKCTNLKEAVHSAVTKYVRQPAVYRKHFGKKAIVSPDAMTSSVHTKTLDSVKNLLATLAPGTEEKCDLNELTTTEIKLEQVLTWVLSGKSQKSISKDEGNTIRDSLKVCVMSAVLDATGDLVVENKPARDNKSDSTTLLAALQIEDFDTLQTQFKDRMKALYLQELQAIQTNPNHMAVIDSVWNNACRICAKGDKKGENLLKDFRKFYLQNKHRDNLTFIINQEIKDVKSKDPRTKDAASDFILTANLKRSLFASQTIKDLTSISVASTFENNR